jgi:DNA-directed RNA polymerase I, II, and III subunit RPABC2
MSTGDLAEMSIDDLEKKMGDPDPISLSGEEYPEYMGEDVDDFEEEEDSPDIVYDRDPTTPPEVIDEKIGSDIEEEEEDLDIEQEDEEDKDDEDIENESNNKIPSLFDDEDDDDDTNVDDDSYDSDEDSFQKLENDINTDKLLVYHPELLQSNYKEINALSKIARNKKGWIIDPLHKTIPFLTKYERARILGIRIKQLNSDSDAFIEVPPNTIDARFIAEEELKQKKLPFIIRRPLPNGGNEYWKLSDLEIIEY